MTGRFARFLRDRLEHPHLPLHLALVAILLTLPALRVGWQMDDHFQRLALSGRKDAGMAPGEIFSTLRGDRVANRRLMDLGILPWWMPEDFRLSFLRTLSVASMRLDYRLWPGSAVLMHLHSLLWLGLLTGAAASLYRQVSGPGWIPGLAALLYAVDDAHALPAAWLANRNALLATAFGVLCLVSHHRWRRGGGWPFAAGSAAFLALALLSGEMGLGAAAYLAAYALFMEQGPLGRRILTLVPSGAVLAGWAILYRLLGHGVSGSGLYLDPLRSPVAFAGALVKRAPFLLLGQWSPVPADLGALLPEDASRRLLGAVLLFLAILGAALAPLLRRDREARFWAAGMLLALLPVCATFPSNRLLFFVGLGAMALLAKFLARVLSRDPSRAAGSRGGGWLIRGLALLMVPAHLVLAPLEMPLGAWMPKIMGGPIVRAVASIPADPALPEQELVIASAPDQLLYVSYLPALMMLENRPLPRRIRALGAGPSPAELRREGSRTLRLRKEGGIPDGPLGPLFRGPADPMKAGDRVELTGLTVEVMEVTGDGRPREVRFRFSVPLEDPSLRWVRWEKEGFVALEPPAVGETVFLPPARGPLDL